MSQTDQIAARLELAQSAARAAGAHALALFHDRANLIIETKHDALDMVSRADREAEDIIRANVAAAFPDDGFLGEEGGGAVRHLGYNMGDRPDRWHGPFCVWPAALVRCNCNPVGT